VGAGGAGPAQFSIDVAGAEERKILDVVIVPQVDGHRRQDSIRALAGDLVHLVGGIGLDEIFVIARAAAQGVDVAVVAALQTIVAGTAIELVLAVASGQRVIALAAEQGVVAQLAVQRIVTASAVQPVVAAAAVDRVAESVAG